MSLISSDFFLPIFFIKRERLEVYVFCLVINIFCYCHPLLLCPILSKRNKNPSNCFSSMLTLTISLSHLPTTSLFLLISISPIQSSLHWQPWRIMELFRFSSKTIILSLNTPHNFLLAWWKRNYWMIKSPTGICRASCAQKEQNKPWVIRFPIPAGKMEWPPPPPPPRTPSHLLIHMRASLSYFLLTHYLVNDLKTNTSETGN